MVHAFLDHQYPNSQKASSSISERETPMNRELDGLDILIGLGNFVVLWFTGFSCGMATTVLLFQLLS